MPKADHLLIQDAQGTSSPDIRSLDTRCSRHIISWHKMLNYWLGFRPLAIDLASEHRPLATVKIPKAHHLMTHLLTYLLTPQGDLLLKLVTKLWAGCRSSYTDYWLAFRPLATSHWPTTTTLLESYISLTPQDAQGTSSTYLSLRHHHHICSWSRSMSLFSNRVNLVLKLVMKLWAGC